MEAGAIIMAEEFTMICSYSSLVKPESPLDKLDWVKVIYEREVPLSLFNHSSCIIGDHLLAYGGMKDGYKISNELRLFQLGNSKLSRRTRTYE